MTRVKPWVTIFVQHKLRITIWEFMRTLSENYKGIEFVRISTLPEDQKQLIWTSLKRDKIIKILKSDCLLNDCVQVHDYEAWYSEIYNSQKISIANSLAETQSQPSYKLAFK